MYKVQSTEYTFPVDSHVILLYEAYDTRYVSYGHVYSRFGKKKVAKCEIDVHVAQWLLSTGYNLTPRVLQPRCLPS